MRDEAAKGPSNAVRSRPADSGRRRVGDEGLSRPRRDDVVAVIGATPVGNEQVSAKPS
jgi:hypothetical protein